MNDFDFDVMQKKRIARGSAHMKRGSKSRKCSLPSDHLTPAQLKRRNGPMSTYNLSAPMTWEQFKKMPMDLQQSYIDSVQARFNVSGARISEDLFHMTGANLRVYASKTGLKYSTARKGYKLTDAEMEVWNKWLTNGEEHDPVSLDPMEELTPVSVEAEKEDHEMQQILEGFKEWSEEQYPEPEPIVEVKEIPKLNLDELTAVFSGEFEPTKFLQWITQLPMPEGGVRIRVEVTRK